MNTSGFVSLTDVFASVPLEYAIVVILETVASVAILVVSLVLLWRRRKRSYLFVTIAFSTLTVRSILGLLTVFGTFAISSHHILEHGLDVVMVGFLFLAVIVAERSQYTKPGPGS